MKLILHERFLALYSQIGLIDAEDDESYPQWDTGKEQVAFGQKGVAVAALGDTKVEVTVYEGNGSPGGTLCSSGTILVGQQGLIVGNEIAADTAVFDWPPGRTTVTIYVDVLPQPKRIDFVLQSLSSAGDRPS